MPEAAKLHTEKPHAKKPYAKKMAARAACPCSSSVF